MPSYQKDETAFTTCLELFSIDKKLSDSEILILKTYIMFSIQDEQSYHRIPDFCFKGTVKSNNMVTSEVAIRLNYLNLISLFDNYKKSRTSNDTKFDFTHDKYSIIFTPNTDKVGITLKINDKSISGLMLFSEYTSMFNIIQNLIINLPGYIINHIQLYDIRTISMHTKKMMGILLSNSSSKVIIENELNNNKEEPISENEIETIEEPVKDPIIENKVETKKEEIKKEETIIIPANTTTNEFNNFNDKINNLDIMNSYDDFISFIDVVFKEWDNKENLLSLLINKFKMYKIDYFKTVSDNHIALLSAGIYKYFSEYVVNNPSRQKKMFLLKIEPNECDDLMERLTIFFVKYEIAALMKNDMKLVSINETCFAPFWMSYLPYVKIDSINKYKTDDIISEMESKTIIKLREMATITVGKFPDYYQDMMNHIKQYVKQ